jgi:hypothetical protein
MRQKINQFKAYHKCTYGLGRPLLYGHPKQVRDHLHNPLARARGYPTLPGRYLEHGDDLEQ